MILLKKLKLLMNVLISIDTCSDNKNKRNYRANIYVEIKYIIVMYSTE